MTLRPAIARLALGAAVALLAACATSPPARFYTLSAAAAPAGRSGTLDVVVGPVAIPAVFDRPEIVIAVGANEVWPDEYNRWAAPLADAIAVAVAEDLSAQLPAPRVRLYAQTAGGEGAYRVVLDVQRFESQPGTAALLDVVWTVRRAQDGAVASGRATVRETVADRGYDALAAAHSRALARMSEDIAAAVRGLAATPPAPAAGRGTAADAAPSRGR